MGTKKGARLFAVLFVICMGCFIPAYAEADSAQIMVAPDKVNVKVDVIISDTSMNGQEVSVVCYAPGWNEDTTDWNTARNYITYIGQVKVSGTTTVSFPIKGDVQSGNYSLVLGYTGGKVSKVFSFDGGENTATPCPAPSPSVSSAAPKSVKV
ncbi:MAG: hypothetical protein K2K09_04220, partial [Lachnospiraceae bacterium]|nr:hypothetical protein [Lachnospiraceae bacterium]